MKKKLLLTLFAALLTAAGGTAKAQKTMKAKKTLVAYFSRTGENYGVGTITKGNTHIIAEMIAKETGGTLFRIEPVKAYPDNYKRCTEVARHEADTKARPAIRKDIAVEGYDVIYIGYPNWWADMPMAVYTFIEKHKWQGKTVIPFCTHEGSGLSDTENKLKKACAGATVLKGLAIRGTAAQKSQSQAHKSVTNWIAKHNK